MLATTVLLSIAMREIWVTNPSPIAITAGSRHPCCSHPHHALAPISHWGVPGKLSHAVVQNDPI
jgi:hypothetical protein